MKQFLAAAAAILMGFGVAWGEAAASQPVTIKAIRTIRIDSPPAYMDKVRNINYQGNQNPNNLPYLTDLSGNQRNPIIVTRSVGIDSVTFAIAVDYSPWREQNPTGQFDAAGLAEEIVGTMRSNVAGAVTNQRDNWVSQLDTNRDQLQESQDQRDYAAAQLKKIDEIVETAGDLSNPTAAGIGDLTRQLEKDLGQAQIDIEGKTARQSTAEHLIAKLRDEAGSGNPADPAMVELQKVVDALQKQLEDQRTQVKAGLAPVTDVDRDEAALAEAKAALLQRQEAAAKTGNGGAMVRVNDELVSLSLDLAELHARSDAMEKRLKALDEVRKQIGELPSEESLMKTLDTANSAIQSLEPAISRLQAELNSKDVPKLTVVESTNVAAGQN